MSIQLFHGDCLAIMKSIPAGSVNMVLCDLPYGTTDCKWDSIISLSSLWQQYLRVARPNAAIVLTAAQPFTSELIASQTKLFKYSWVWSKTQITGFLNAKKQPLRCHEDIVVFYRSQPTYNPQFTEGKPYKISRTHATDVYSKQNHNETVSDGRRYPVSILDIPQVRIKNGHPTQKPVALMEYLIRTYTNEGNTVLDNCMGSGTTGVACVNTGRNFIGIEKDEQYFEIAEQRIRAAEVREPELDQFLPLPAAPEFPELQAVN